MNHIYLYDAQGADFSTLGYGPIMATDARFSETGNGDSTLTVEVAYDEKGIWAYIQPEMILAAYVPTRMTPEIDGGKIVTGVEIWTVKQTASKTQRILYTTKNGNEKKDKLPKGTTVTVVKKPTDSKRYKVKASKYGTGWIDKDALGYDVSMTLPDDPAGIETAASPWMISKQLFRIHNYVRNETSITLEARHVTYDLLGNVTRYYEKGAADAQTALNAILGNTLRPHNFSLYSNIAGERTGVDWRFINPISALMDPEKGFIARWGGYLVRDNFGMYVLANIGTNRGVEITYGKNLQGVEVQTDYSDVVTGILPLGRTENGSYLRLTDDGSDDIIFITSEAEANVERIYVLDCASDATVSESVSVNLARKRMREAAQELIDGGAGLPNISMSVDFLQLGDTDEYSAFRDLERLFLFDWARVRLANRGIEALMQISGIEYDPIRQRFIKVYMGDGVVSLTTMKLSSFQIPGGLNGYKILPGTIGGGQLTDDAINVRHIQADSITARNIQADAIATRHLQAGSVTAEKIKAGTINADLIEAGTIIADLIAAGAIEAYHITSGAITTEKMTANTIDAKVIKSGTITADLGLFGENVIGTAQIADGSITEAKIVSLTGDVIQAGTLKADRLLIKGDDGLFYKINAEASGLSLSQLTEDQYKNYINGTVIVAKSITAAQIAAKAITANEIAANTITAAEIDVAKFFAAEATIDQINAMDISGNKYLQLAVGEAAGGMNLLRDSGVAVSNRNYPTAIYTLADIPEVGEMVTVTIWGASMEGGTNRTWGVFHGDGNTRLGNLTWVSTGRYSGTFEFKMPVTEGGVAGQIRIYAMPANSEQTVNIGKAKLERGTKSTEWTPSPLDAASSLIAGSTVLITEEKVKISTPEFVVDTQGAKFNIPGATENGQELVTIDKEEGLSALKFSLPGVMTQHEGGVFSVGTGGDFNDLSTAFAEINGKYLAGDVFFKIADATSARARLAGVSGPGVVQIAPINLLDPGEDTAWTYNGTTRTRLNATDSSKGFSLTSPTAATYRAATLSVGHAGAMGLRPGAKIAFRVNIQIASGSTAYPHAYIYIGGVFHGGVTGATGTDTTQKVLTTTFTVKDGVKPGDEVVILFRVCGGAACSAGAAVYFRNPVMEIGSAISSLNTGMNTCQIAGLDVEGCGAQVCLHEVTLSEAINARQSAISANRCTFAGADGMVIWGGSGAIYNCYGECSGYAARAMGGGAIEIVGSCPAGTQAGLIDDGSASGESPGGSAPVVSQTESFKAAKSGTYSGGAWWTSDAALRQGWTTANKKLRGAVWFEHDISADNITKMTLRLRRAEGYGKSSGVEVKIYGTNSNALTGEPVKAGTAVEGTIGQGKVKSFDITSLKAYKGFMVVADDDAVIAGKTYSTNFARFTGTGGGDDTIPLLTITHT